MIFIAGLFFIVILIFLNFLMGGKDGIKVLRKSRTLSAVEKKHITKRWYEIEELVNAQGATASNQAVIKADKLLDSVLKQLALPGDTMGDRLKSARDKFSSYEIYDTAWKAHKMRNAVVHEDNFDLHKRTAKSTLGQFRKVLKDLRAL